MNSVLRIAFIALGVVGLLGATPLMLFLLLMSGFAEPDGRRWIHIYSIAVPAISFGLIILGVFIKPPNQKNENGA
jgi:hypothetical protein